LFLGLLNRSLGKQSTAARQQFIFAADAKDLGPTVARAIGAQPQTIALIAGPRSSARMVVALRSAGYRGPIFGGPWMGRRAFAETAGASAEGVSFPLLYAPADPASGLCAEFTRRFHKSPDYAAAGTYDAVTMVVAAVRKAGLNRARIGDALRGLSGWKGALGEIRWDQLGGNPRPVSLGVIHNGRSVPASP
jgi:branched-chain amino acid transport system substrate-binding protein